MAPFNLRRLAVVLIVLSEQLRSKGFEVCIASTASDTLERLCAGNIDLRLSAAGLGAGMSRAGIGFAGKSWWQSSGLAGRDYFERRQSAGLSAVHRRLGARARQPGRPVLAAGNCSGTESCSAPTRSAAIAMMEYLWSPTNLGGKYAILE